MPAPGPGKCNFSVYWGVDGTNGSAFGDSLWQKYHIFPHSTNYMAHSIGMFPKLCQTANTSGNLAAIQANMPRNVGNPEFDGLAQIDYEGWNPWDVEDPSVDGWGHGGAGMGLRNQSIDLVRAKHPSWSDQQLLVEAEKEYLAACTGFITATIKECKRLRPRAKWAFWNYPETTYTLAPESTHNRGPPPGTPTICEGVGSPAVTCSYGPFFQKLNDQIMEYYTAADLLTPSIYIPPNMTTDAALRKQFILATIREAVRVRDAVKAKTGLYKPVIAQAWSIVFGTVGTPCPSHCNSTANPIGPCPQGCGSGGAAPCPRGCQCPPGCNKVFHDFLDKAAVTDMIGMVYRAGGDGVLLWGHPDAFDHTAKDHALVSGYPDYIENTLGPAMQAFDTNHKGALCTVHPGRGAFNAPPPPPPPPPPPGYQQLNAVLGVGKMLGTAACSSRADCPAEAAAKCNATAGCKGFAVCAVGPLIADLYPGGAAGSVNRTQCGNTQWTFFCQPGWCGSPCDIPPPPPGPLPPQPPPPAPVPSTVKWEVKLGERQLFVDELGVASRAGIDLVMHSPKKKGAVIRPSGFSDARRAWGGPYNSVACQVRTAPIWLEHEGRFRFLVANCNASSPHAHWYTSVDGVAWTHEPGGVSDGATYMVVYDPRDPNPAARYKSMIPCVGGACTAAGARISPDGIKWTALPNTALRITAADEQQLSYDPKSGRFIYTVKRGNQFGRAVALTTTTDFYSENWTDHGVVFGTDAYDQVLGRQRIQQWMANPCSATFFCASDPVGRGGKCFAPEQYKVDVYNMGTFWYESLYIGVPALYHAVGKDGATINAGAAPAAAWCLLGWVVAHFDLLTAVFVLALRRLEHRRLPRARAGLEPRHAGEIGSHLSLIIVANSFSLLHKTSRCRCADCRQHWERVGNRSWFLQPSCAYPDSGAFDLQQMLGPSNVIGTDSHYWSDY
jgi:hypothetical protein